MRTLKGREVYGYKVAKILSSRGNKIHLGYLYEVLGEMENEEIVESRWEKGVGGPKRKLYSLTDKGETALNSLLKDTIQTIHHFYNAYLASLPPKSNVVDIIGNVITKIKPFEIIHVFVLIISFPLNPAFEYALHIYRKKNKKELFT